MSIIAYPLEAIEYTAEDAQSYFSTRKSGVYSEDITFTPEGMTVTLSPFLAWFNYAKFKGCSVAVTEPQTLTFSPSHTILDRIDRVVLRLDLSLNRAYFEILEGTPSSTPIAKTISKTEVINDISPFYVRIKAGATQITPADITSTILDESLCGIMRDGVTGIPTSQLQEQVEELLVRLHEAIDSVQDGSAFMLGDVYDPKNKSKAVAFDDEVLKKTGGSFVSPLIDESAGVGAGYKTIYPTNSAYKEIIETKLPNDKRVFVTRVVNGADYNEVIFGLSNSKNDAPAGLSMRRTNDNVYTILFAANKQLFGEHNKPSGSYIGNGSASRTIDLGSAIGNVVYIYSSDLSCQGFATRNRGISWPTASQYEDPTIANADVSVVDGQLIIHESWLLNDFGKTYFYQVL